MKVALDSLFGRWRDVERLYILTLDGGEVAFVIFVED